MNVQTDRELLELAAKAAGADFEYDPMTDAIEILSEIGGVSGIWSPLTDDGDALRLAVKLNMRVSLEFDHVEVEAPGGFVYIREDFSADPYLAVRRAIVRAAAAIGETL